MFHGELNLRQIRRNLMSKAHDVGLVATVVCRKQMDFVDIAIDLSMNQNRFKSYCHREGDKVVMSHESRIRQMQAESKMVNDFWNGLLPEFARAKRKIQWWNNGDQDNTKESTKYDIRLGSVEELRLREPGMTGRTLRVFL